jgi:hypothetical protein
VRLTVPLLAVIAMLGCPAAGANATDESAQELIVTFRDTSSALRSSPGTTARFYGSRPAYEASGHARRLITQLSREYEIDWVAGWRIDLLGVHCAVFRARDAEHRDLLLARLREDRRIESVQAMHTFRTSARSTQYNDPYFRLQRGVEAIRVPEAHRWSRGRRIPVAIIDSGIDTRHPELRGRVRIVRNFVDEDEVRFRADRHGTAVAGVIAALTNNGTGIIGVAPASELLALKACWHERPDAPALCSTLTLAEALVFAIEQKARIINLSLTGPADPLLTRLVRRALDRGIVVVAASEDASQADGFPVGVAGVIAVADSDDRPSSRRAPLQRSMLAAPGREVLTLVPGKGYDYMSGSSISAAMVSGVIALLLEHRVMTREEVRALLEQTSLSRQGGIPPLVNACDAVASLVRATPCDASGTAVASVGHSHAQK